MSRHTAVVALGANLGDRRATLAEAVEALGYLGLVEAVSPLYETEPIGGPDQDAFLNAVAIVDTSVQDPAAFLGGLHAIEADHGRVRDERWGPRSLDLDLIAWDDATIDGDLVVPHPRAAQRRFVLEPLADVRPGFAFPDGRSVGELLEAVADQEVERVAPRGWWVVETAERPLRIIVAGLGGAGVTLASAARLAGHELVGVLSRSGRDGALGAPTFGWAEPLPDADLVLLTVPDRAITAAVGAIAGNLPDGAAVVHCSGITPLGVLGPLEGGGHPIGAFHPLVALTGHEEAVVGAGVAVDGSDADVRTMLEGFARSLRMSPFSISDEQRFAYHAAASIAANHLTALLGVARDVAGGAAVPFDRYRALVERSVGEVFRVGPEAALTGPVARGDEGTVAAQRRAVEEVAPQHLELFDALNETTRRLANPQ